MAKKPKPEDVEAALARWRTKLKRAFGAVERLEQRQKRMRPRGHALISDLAGTIGPAIRESIKDQKVIGKPVAMIAIAAPELKAVEDAIPDFLRRTPQADIEARVQIEVEQANQRLARSRARISKLKAKKAGDLKKMPLSGKAALDHIRNG